MSNVNAIQIPNHHYIIMNYTPHSVTLLGANLGSDVFESVGVARCQERVEVMTPGTYDPFGDGGMTFSLPLVRKSFGTVEGLPPQDPTKPWKLYIVSQIVADACPGRNDLLVPSDIVRDAHGVVLGCKSFSWRPAAQS